MPWRDSTKKLRHLPGAHGFGGRGSSIRSVPGSTGQRVRTEGERHRVLPPSGSAQLPRTIDLSPGTVSVSSTAACEIGS